MIIQSQHLLKTASLNSSPFYILDKVNFVLWRNLILRFGQIQSQILCTAPLSKSNIPFHFLAATFPDFY